MTLRKEEGRLSGADETRWWNLYVKCLTGARMKIPMNGIWASRMPLLTSSGASNDSTYGSIAPF